MMVTGFGVWSLESGVIQWSHTPNLDSKMQEGNYRKEKVIPHSSLSRTTQHHISKVQRQKEYVAENSFFCVLGIA